jgi:hypothetical protein
MQRVTHIVASGYRQIEYGLRKHRRGMRRADSVRSGTYDAGMFSDEATEAMSCSPEPPTGECRAAEDREPATVPLAALEDELTELAAEINAGTCRWLELVAEFDRREGWGGPGLRSCAHWLSWRCAVSPGEAREQVRVASRLHELPVLRAAFARGELSYSKMRALTRVAEEACEEVLLEVARYLTAAQLERALSAYRRVTNEEAQDAHERESVSYFWDEDGSLVLRARLPAEDGALLLRALEAARDSLRERRREDGDSSEADSKSETEGDEEDDNPNAEALEARAIRAEPPPAPPPRPDNVEALLAVAERALARPPGDRSGGERRQVVLHVDASVLSDDGEGRCELEDGPALSPETARRLACDSSLVTIAERAGETLSVGRRTRTIPPALRRALTTRDRGCRFPGCTNHRFVDAHHVQHWARGGETSLENLLSLCRSHHRLVHEGGYAVERDHDGGLRFRDPGGAAIPSVPRSPPADPEALGKRNRRAGIVINTDTGLSGTGERMDLGLAVESLLRVVG